MTSPTKPSNLQRLSVVIVMHLGLVISALNAVGFSKFPASKINICIASSIGSKSLLWKQILMFNSVLSHVSGMARSAKTLTSSVSLIAAGGAFIKTFFGSNSHVSRASLSFTITV